MSDRVWLNGCDCFLQSLDWELRRDGFAGFASQIVLEAEGEVSAREVAESVGRRAAQYPVLRARFRRALPRFYPYWSIDYRSEGPYPRVHEHAIASGDSAGFDSLQCELFNRPLAAGRGELLRFDLIKPHDGGDTRVIMTWHHPLLDSHGGEQLLALIGRPELPGPEPWKEGNGFAGSYTRRLLLKKTFRERWREAQRSLDNIGIRSHPAPVSLYTGRKDRAARRQNYHVIDFSAEESDVVSARSKEICGALRATDYYLWATLAEVAELHSRLGVATPAFVVTLPIGMRPRGSTAPLFSTQESTLFFNLAAETIRDRAATLECLRSQTTQTFRDELLLAYLYGMEMSRPFPHWLFMKLSRNAMRGELGSFFFANTGRAPAESTIFLGRRIVSFAHAPAVAAPPGLGIFFYRFGERLRCTIVYVEGMLESGEVLLLADRMKRRLLNPDESTSA